MNPEPSGPDALTVLTSILTPILSFAAVLVASLITARSDKRHQARLHHEEKMRTLRWSAELVVSTDPLTHAVGQAALDALVKSDSANEEVVDLVCRIAHTLHTADRPSPTYAGSAEPFPHIGDYAQDFATEDSGTKTRKGNQS